MTDKIAFINSAGAKLLGAESPDQLIGRSVKDFIHTQNYELSRQRLQQLKQSKRVPSIEETFIRLDGTVFYAEASAMPITYCGKPAILVVAHDITERKLAEEALQENERRFRSLTQSIPDGIMLVDHNNTIIYWNHGSQNIFGYSEEEVLGKPSGMLLPEQDRETHRKGFEKLHGTGESSGAGQRFLNHAASEKTAAYSRQRFRFHAGIPPTGYATALSSAILPSTNVLSSRSGKQRSISTT